MGNGILSQVNGRTLRHREGLMFHVMFLLPTVVIAGLAALALAMRLYQMLGA